MKSRSILTMAAVLFAPSSIEAQQALDRFHALNTMNAMIHVESRIEHPSQPKDSPRETRQDLGIRIENGELWTQKTGISDELSEADLKVVLDPLPQIRNWMAHERVNDSAASAGDLAEFSVKPETPARLKRIWELEGRVQLWFTKDGTPSRALLVQRFKGRTQRIAPTEEVILRIDYTFKDEGGHLVIARLDENREERNGYEVTKHHRVLELRTQARRS